MRNPTSSVVLITLLAVSVSFFGAGCSGGHSEEDGHNHASKEGGDGHAHGHGEDEGGGAEFAEGKGLIIHEEAANVIGLQTAEVTEEKLASSFSTVAQVFQLKSETESPYAMASAMVSSEAAKTLKVGNIVSVKIPGKERLVEGTFVRLDQATKVAIDRVEAIVKVVLNDNEVSFGSFLTVVFSGEEREVFAMPRSALLKAATGNFAYVKNGDRFLRTEVVTGAFNDTVIEILEGVYPGDVVASSGVEDLWLIELRFTKGGGHSH